METPRVIISAILEKNEGRKKYIFLQTRWKPQSSPTYSGLLEIPAGGVDGYENIFNAVKREVAEETGLRVIRIDGIRGTAEKNIPGNESMVFQPFVCQQMLKSNGGLPWIGFVFRCEIEGEIQINSKEAKDPRWISVDELKKILQEKPELFFPLQYPVLKYYVEST